MNWELMSDQELHEFGIEAILPYVQNEGVTIGSINVNLGTNPQIAGERWGSPAMIVVRTACYPAKGQLTQQEHMKILSWADQKGATAFFASVGIICVSYPDKTEIFNEAHRRLPIRHAGYNIAYEGLLVMSASNRVSVLNSAPVETAIDTIRETGLTVSYNFAHMALPLLVLMNPKKFYQDISGTKAQQYLVGLWQGLEGKMNLQQSHQGLMVSKRVLDDNIEAYFIHLPKPTKIPEAFIAAAVFKVKKQFLSTEVINVRYFTLELGRNPARRFEEYHFCEWVGNVLVGREHKNHGRLAGSSEQDLLSGIKDILST